MKSCVNATFVTGKTVKNKWTSSPGPDIKVFRRTRKRKSSFVVLLKLIVRSDASTQETLRQEGKT